MLSCQANGANETENIPIQLFTYQVEGMIELQQEHAVGPGVDTLVMLFEQLGVETDIEVQPFARTLASAAKYPNTCSFPTDWSAERAQHVDFVLPLAQVDATIYSLVQKPLALTELKDAFVVTLTNFSAHRLLDQYGATKIMVSDPVNAFKMLLNGRVEYLLMDKPMANVLMKSSGVKLHAANVLYSGSAWLACNRVNNLPPYNEIAKAMQSIITSKPLRASWRAASLDPVFVELWGEHGEKWHHFYQNMLAKVSEQHSPQFASPQ